VTVVIGPLEDAPGMESRAVGCPECGERVYLAIKWGRRLPRSDEVSPTGSPKVVAFKRGPTCHCPERAVEERVTRDVLDGYVPPPLRIEEGP